MNREKNDQRHILIVGSGSVGKRHAENLHGMGCEISCSLVNSYYLQIICCNLVGASDSSKSGPLMKFDFLPPSACETSIFHIVPALSTSVLISCLCLRHVDFAYGMY